MCQIMNLVMSLDGLAIFFFFLLNIDGLAIEDLVDDPKIVQNCWVHVTSGFQHTQVKSSFNELVTLVYQDL